MFFLGTTIKKILITITTFFAWLNVMANQSIGEI